MATGSARARPHGRRPRRDAPRRPTPEPAGAGVGRRASRTRSRQICGRRRPCRCSRVLLALLVGAVIILVSELSRPATLDPTLPLHGLLRRSSRARSGRCRRDRQHPRPGRAARPRRPLGRRSASRPACSTSAAQGQFLIGALGAVGVGAALATAPPLDRAIPLARLAPGMLAGALWGFIPGRSRRVTGAHEVVTTIMLNYDRRRDPRLLVTGPLLAPGFSFAPDRRSSATPRCRSSSAATSTSGSSSRSSPCRSSGGSSIRSTLGFEIRTVGANPDAARYAGMRPAC